MKQLGQYDKVNNQWVDRMCKRVEGISELTGTGHWIQREDNSVTAGIGGRTLFTAKRIDDNWHTIEYDEVFYNKILC